MQFSMRARVVAAPVIRSIIYGPFHLQLTQGTLPKSAFFQFIGQDQHFLRAYSATLEKLTHQANTKHALFIENFALQSVAYEQKIQARYAKHLCASSKIVAPYTAQYIEHLHTSSRSFETGIASILTCFDLYASLGGYFKKTGISLKGHPYSEWIKSYTKPEFSQTATGLREIADEVALLQPHKPMLHAFYTSALMEKSMMQAHNQKSRFSHKC